MAPALKSLRESSFTSFQDFRSFEEEPFLEDVGLEPRSLERVVLQALLIAEPNLGSVGMQPTMMLTNNSAYLLYVNDHNSSRGKGEFLRAKSQDKGVECLIMVMENEDAVVEAHGTCCHSSVTGQLLWRWASTKMMLTRDLWRR